MNFLSISRIVGILITCFSFTMLIPAIISLIYKDGGGDSFIETFFITFIVGALLWYFCNKYKSSLRSRDGFLIVLLFWVVLGSLGAIPFALSEHPHLTFASAVFESLSGLTTTGATVITGLDNLPHSILFYRQQLHWLGGMGIIVLAVAIIPILGIGGMSLYRAEATGPLKEHKITPRIAASAKFLWLIYVGITIACALLFYLGGMNLFDAISHSFATVSTGGFSTHDASIGYFNSSFINWVTIVFLFISGINFSLHFTLIHNFKPQKIIATYFKDPECKAYIYIILFLTIVSAIGLYLTNYQPSLFLSIEHSLFQVLSVLTTAGFATTGFNDWPSFLPLLILFSSFVGGCAGSTSGGIKVIRVLLLYLQGRREINRLIHPNIAQPIKISSSVVPDSAIEGIWAFFSVYIMFFFIYVIAVVACGVEPYVAINAVISTINNVGPGLGELSSNFTTIPDSAKWILSLAMVTGRLEVFTLLVILTPAFWRS